jgi:hypothetical protein
MERTALIALCHYQRCRMERMGVISMRQASSFYFHWILRGNLVAALCVSAAVVLATQTQAATEATAIDHTTCDDAKPIKGLAGIQYLFRLGTSSGKHELGLVSCDMVGALARGHLFTLYDLNGGSVENGDEVAILGLHGRLLGVPETGKLTADRMRFGKTERFTISVITKNAEEVKTNTKITLKTKNGRFLSAKDGKIRIKKTTKPGKAETFTVTKLTSGAIRKGISGVAETLANVLLEKILGKPFSEKVEADVRPKECAAELEKKKVPAEVQKAQDKTAKTDKQKKNKLAKIIGPLLKQIDKSRACGKLKFKIVIPGTDLGMEMFYTKVKRNAAPVWHIAMMAGPKTLNQLSMVEAIPALKDLFGNPKVDKLVAIFSEDKGEKNLTELSANLGTYLENYQQAIMIPGIFQPEKRKLGTIRLDQGVNLFVEVQGATKGMLATASNALFPGVSKSKKPWRMSGVVGSRFMRILLNKISSIKGSDADTFADKKDFRLQVWLPGFTPYPFNLLKNKNAFHMDLNEAMFLVDISKSKAGGTTSRTLNLLTKTWAEYWLLGKHFPIVSDGTITVAKGKLKGALQGVFEPGNKKEDPLGFIPGIHASKLMFGGGAGYESGKEGKKGTLMYKVGAQVGIDGYKDIATAFAIQIAAKGNKVKLADIQVALQGEDDEGKLELSTLPLVGKVPFVNEWTLEKAVLGIAPTKGVPDFYITGGGTWKRNNLGGKTAILKMKLNGRQETFVFTRTNDFNFTSLMSKNMDKTVKGALTALKTPRSMLILSTAKGKDEEELGDLKVTDLPPSLVPMFDELVSDTNGMVPVYGDGVTLVTALDFSEAEDALMKEAVRKLGFDKLGTDGTIVVAGSIGGLRQKAIRVALAAKLPQFELPTTLPGGGKSPLGYLVAFDKVGSELFLKVQLLPKQSIELGVSGKLWLNIPPIGTHASSRKSDKLILDGRIYLLANTAGDAGFRVNGGMTGRWNNPLGLGNFAIENPAVVLGMDVVGAPQIEIGLGGTTFYKFPGKGERKYATDLIVNFTPTIPPIPTKLGARYQMEEASLLTDLEMYHALLAGVLTGPMADQVLKALPDSKTKKTAKKVQKEINKRSLTQLMQLDKIPLALLKLRDVDVYFGTPGATIPGRYAEGVPGLGFKIAGKGYFELFGKNHKLSETNITLSLRDGLRALSKLSSLTLGKLKVGGPPTMDLKADWDSLPYLRIKGMVQVGSLWKDTTDIELSKDRMAFIFQKNLGSVFNMEFDVHTDGSNLTKTRKFLVEARGLNTIDKFAAEEMLPAMGVPGPIVEALKTSTPLVIRKYAMSGDLVGFTGSKEPIDVYLEPVFHGDDKAVKPIEARIPGVDWKLPEKGILLGAEVIEAMTRSLIEHLMANPVKTPAVDLGVVKFEPGHFGGVERTNTKQKKEKLFLLKAGMRLPLSKPTAKVLFKKDFVEAAFTESLLHGLLTSDFVATGTPDASGLLTDMTLNGTVTGDLDKWMQDKGLKVVDDIFEGLSAGSSDARKKLEDTQAEVDKLTKNIAAMKKEVLQQQKKARSPLNSAQKEVDKHQKRVEKLDSKVSSRSSSINKKCNQNFKKCVLGHCASVPNYAARGVCETKKLKLIAEREIFRGQLRVAQATLELSKKALDTFKKGARYVPVEFDPRVSGLIAARAVASASLTQAKNTVAAFAKLEKALRNEVVGEVSKPGLVTLKRGRIRGSLAGALEGQPVILDLEYTHKGATYKDRLAYHLFPSAANDAFNDAQLEVIALGAVTKIATAKAKKWTQNMAIAPYDFVTRTSKLYLDRMGEVDQEVRKSIETYAVDAVPDAEDFRAGESIAEANDSAASELRLAHDEVFKDGQEAAKKIGEVPDTLSFGKYSMQSSTGWGGDSRRAVDGIVDGAFSTKSVSHTLKDENPWWQVDLGNVYKIDKIQVFNRTDCCVGRLNGAKVMVSDWPFTGDPMQVLKGDGISRFDIGKAKPKNELLINKTGQFVRIQLPRSDYLHLAEVVVFGKRTVVKRSTGKPLDRLRAGNLTFQVESSSKCFDATFGDKNHTRPVTWTCNKNHPNQQFRANYKDQTFFQLVNQRNGKCVGIKSPLNNAGSAVIMYDCEDKWIDELWKKEDVGNGRFLLRNKYSSKCLDLAWNKKGNGKKFHQWHCSNNNKAQRFRLEK